MIVIDESGCGTSIDLPAGDTLVVRLAGQAATGYVWVVEEAGGLVLSDKRYVSGGDRPGAAGYHEFRFEAGEAGTHVLRFKRGREWEETAAGRCEVVVRVR
ncbi:protease inhibitor I42 family protein [Massilia suwonensis]|uniref:Protease inhibitor I42 family protein n=1 Tax=Massilia suwonensis TaxID=648895 RepID=A0ABW0MTK6_9BURK